MIHLSLHTNTGRIDEQDRKNCKSIGGSERELHYETRSLTIQLRIHPSEGPAISHKPCRWRYKPL